MKNSKWTYVIVLGIGLFLSMVLFAEKEKIDTAEFKGKTIKELLSEYGKIRVKTEKDKERWIALMHYLENEASPQTEEDMILLEVELNSSDLYHLQRGEKWLNNIKDQRFKYNIFEIFKKLTKKYPPGKTEKEVSDIEEMNRQGIKGQILVTLMKKLSEFQVKEAIPIIKKYTKDEDLGLYAYTALAKLKDEKFFGKDRRERLKNYYVDKDDPSTKPWIKEIILDESEKDGDVRGSAVTVFQNELADADDEEFIKRMLKHHDFRMRRTGVIIVSRLVNEKMVFPNRHKIFNPDKFKDIIFDIFKNDKDDYPRSEAARCLGYLGVKEAIPLLEKALDDPKVNSESAAALKRLTGKDYSDIVRQKDEEYMEKKKKMREEREKSRKQ